MISFGKYRFGIQQDFGTFRTQVALWEELPDGRRAAFIWEKRQFTVIESGAMMPEGAVIPLEGSTLQAMMDALWEYGIRPKERRFDNEMTLLNAHLEDMRRLVFKEPA